MARTKEERRREESKERKRERDMRTDEKGDRLRDLKSDKARTVLKLSPPSWNEAVGSSG